MKAILKHGVIATAVSTILLGGCMNTTKVENKVDVITNSQYIVSMPESQFMPTPAELTGEQKSVVVLPVKIDSNATFETGAVRQVSSELENGLITAGVEIVDRSLATKLGDEIIIPSLCWSTSLWPIIQAGLKPVFVDVNPPFFSNHPPLKT